MPATSKKLKRRPPRRRFTPKCPLLCLFLRLRLPFLRLLFLLFLPPSFPRQVATRRTRRASTSALRATRHASSNRRCSITSNRSTAIRLRIPVASATRDSSSARRGCATSRPIIPSRRTPREWRIPTRHSDSRAQRVTENRCEPNNSFTSTTYGVTARTCRPL